MQDTLEKALLERLKKGDKHALEELYDSFSPMLMAVAMRYLACREDAEDVMHEALIKIIRGLDKFNPRFSGSFEIWMKKITINTSLNFLRNKMKARNLNGWEALNNTTADEEPEDDKPFPDRLDPETVIRLIGELPDGYRTVLNLYVFENYTHKDIATELGIAENTSKSQLSKARALLRKKVIAFCNLHQMVEK